MRYVTVQVMLYHAPDRLVQQLPTVQFMRTYFFDVSRPGCLLLEQTEYEVCLIGDVQDWRVISMS